MLRNNFLEKIFCTVTNVLNKLSKLRHQTEYILFLNSLFLNKNKFYKSAERSTNICKPYFE